jgi:hypothetical protein
MKDSGSESEKAERPLGELRLRSCAQHMAGLTASKTIDGPGVTFGRTDNHLFLEIVRVCREAIAQDKCLR